MVQNGETQAQTSDYVLPEKHAITNMHIKPVRIVAPIAIFLMIIVVFAVYTHAQKRMIISNGEYIVNEMAEKVADDVKLTVEYAESSIKSVAISVAQTMTAEVLDYPSASIAPLMESTPFSAIEYIRADGMNVMNIGEPFDASDRVYFIEGMKGKTGVWNNYSPKTSQDTLMNFYAPLFYDNQTVGVITGYIEASKRIAPLLETKFYGHDTLGILLDENDMVICSNFEGNYVKNLSLDIFLDRFGVTEEQRRNAHEIFSTETNGAVAFRDSNGEGRVSVKFIGNTGWKVIIVIPSEAFDSIISENTMEFVWAIVVIGLIMAAYTLSLVLQNAKSRRRYLAENAKLEEDNRIFNEENQRAFSEISEIRDIIASANMGTWRIELVENEEPRMYVDDKMKQLLGIEGVERTPEKTYTDWYSNITPEAVSSVLQSVGRMEQGFFDENTYLWVHPSKGIRYVRCGGTAEAIPGGYSLRGYHYDVDEVVRKEQAQMLELQSALNEKKEYYATLGAFGDVLYSMHVINLKDDSVIAYNAKNEVKQIADHKYGATDMMHNIMNTVIVDEFLEAALEFTDLTTLAERMQGKIISTKELVGKRIGWFLASFIVMEKDEEGKPTKVIFTTRCIDEEKKQEEQLINKSQTDELTGLLNRRAFEDEIYVHNDIPEEDNFVYLNLDVNGLKVINDSLGHSAGDELIVGAGECMKKCLGPYGRLFRTGGDEFVAILFCDNRKITKALDKFDYLLANWKGKQISNISVSYGWASKEEFPDLSVRQLGSLAEKRMYEAKSAHYRKSGVDRRGQQDAHKVLCELYTKILKINISDDTYQIVNVDASEKTKEKGFAEKISEWLISFGKTGQVHPDDLQEYLRQTDLRYMSDYFKGNKTSLHIFYRRKYADEFKQVMMELVPANDYSDDDQSLFLYVKNIDK